MLTHQTMYNAIVAKDASFEGTFITGVKTTGIFCRPTCTARKPKAENVEFFKTANEAISKGYRPCKICRPLELIGETPDDIKQLLQELEKDPSTKLKDEDLVAKGLEPHTIRRWFLKNHGLTFHAFQRMSRINAAFKKPQEGDTITAVAFEAGYESLSGFNDSFKSIFGMSPSHRRHKRLINLHRLETPLGTMIACATEEGICLLEFSDRKMLETELKDLARRLNADIIQANHPHFESLKTELGEYFQGKRQQFSVPLFTPGTTFQQLVWQALQTIPYGTTTSYKQQSLFIRKPEAVRAVANANGMNRVSILVPCHRVIGENGQLTGYGGGLYRKQWLLDLEKANG